MRVGESFCPGIVHAVPAKDGLLLRIRVPGGFIKASQLKAIAHISQELRDGTIEITSRANLQIRSVRREDHTEIVEALSLEGLLPSRQHDRVRNIVTSPMAGIDGEEIIDPRPLVYELDRRLRSDAVLANLHPKFSFAIYGGDKRFSKDRDDLELSAILVGNDTLLQLSLAGNRMGFATAAEHATDVLQVAAATCMDLAREYGVPARVRLLSDIPGVLERILSPLSPWLKPCADRQLKRSVEQVPLGIYSAVQQDRVNIVPGVPLGRLTMEQAKCVSEVACDCDADLRLTPWRGVVLASAPQHRTQEIVGRLRSVGLMCDGEDGYRGITACAGSVGCEASLADVRSDASAIAQLLAGRGLAPDWTVHLSGCEKQCARRHGATADLVATASGYGLSIHGSFVAHDCSSATAIDAVVALHKNLMAEVAAQ